MRIVKANSVVREIWGDKAVVLFIFAGAAAEFALHKTVDWLFFTGKLPADPIGRMCSTLAFARQIIFAENCQSHSAISGINKAHAGVEAKRERQIPNWGYQDVLYMLIFYSIAAFELLKRPLTEEEKNEVVEVFIQVGRMMGIRQLPQGWEEWLEHRKKSLHENYEHTADTKKLFLAYRRQLGVARYILLLEMQRALVPKELAGLLSLRNPIVIRYFVVKRMVYTLASSRFASLLLPRQYLKLFQ